MPKIIVTADVHCGVPKKLHYSIWALSIMKQYAIDNDIKNVLILGDLFHDRVNLNIEVINATYDFFESAKEVTWWSFPGNHDMYLKNSWDVNSLRPLDKLVNVITEVSYINIDGGNFWVIPFVYKEDEFMETVKSIEKKHKKGDVLLTHVGVHNAKLNECFLIKNWSMVDFSSSKFDRVLTGHFHCHQKVGDNVWYPGSPVAFRFDEGFVPHGFLVYDTDSRVVEFVEITGCSSKKVEIEQPPSYLTINDDDLKGKNKSHFNKNHVRIVLSRDYTRDEFVKLEKSIKDKGARSVSWYKPKEKQIEVDAAKKSEIDMKDPSRVLKLWLDKDKPKDISEVLIMKINDEIIQEAEERISVASDHD